MTNPSDPITDSDLAQVRELDAKQVDTDNFSYDDRMDARLQMAKLTPRLADECERLKNDLDVTFGMLKGSRETVDTLNAECERLRAENERRRLEQTASLGFATEALGDAYQSVSVSVRENIAGSIRALRADLARAHEALKVARKAMETQKSEWINERARRRLCQARPLELENIEARVIECSIALATINEKLKP